MLQEQQQLSSSADIAAAMLRFCEEAAYPSRLGPPEGWPRTADPCYIFRYSNERVLRDKIADYLGGLTGPALLSPTMTAGTVVVTLLDDLGGAALSAAKARFEAQGEAARVIPLKDDDLILLELDEETLLFTAASLYEWSKRFVVDVAWGISRLSGDERADFSLNVIRSDGHRSKHARADI